MFAAFVCVLGGEVMSERAGNAIFLEQSGGLVSICAALGAIFLLSRAREIFRTPSGASVISAISSAPITPTIWSARSVARIASTSSPSSSPPSALRCRRSQMRHWTSARPSSVFSRIWGIERGMDHPVLACHVRVTQNRNAIYQLRGET